MFSFLTSILQIPVLKTNIFFKNKLRTVFEILEHLPYLLQRIVQPDMKRMPLVTVCSVQEAIGGIC